MSFKRERVRGSREGNGAKRIGKEYRGKRSTRALATGASVQAGRLTRKERKLPNPARTQALASVYGDWVLRRLNIHSSFLSHDGPFLSKLRENLVVYNW